MQQRGLSHPGEYLSITDAPRPRNMAQMKEQVKTPEKELCDEEIANLSDAQFKTLVMRMLTEIVEHGLKIEKEVKAMQSEINQNTQKNISEGKETGTQINNLEQKEEINIQPERNEEIRIQKNDERLRNLWDNFKCSKIQIIGFPKGEEEEQDMENIFEKIMKEKFSNMVKGLTMKVQETQSPKEIESKEKYTKTHHN